MIGKRFPHNFTFSWSQISDFFVATQPEYLVGRSWALSTTRYYLYYMGSVPLLIKRLHGLAMERFRLCGCKTEIGRVLIFSTVTWIRYRCASSKYLRPALSFKVVDFAV